MHEVTRVNFHCHSVFSDGDLPPETVAENLAAAGARYAALTDHDSVEGLERFQEALRRRGVGVISGVEITTRHKGRELHLLGYGFDPDHAELKATLLSLRQAQAVETHSVAGLLRRSGAGISNGSGDETVHSAAPHGSIETADAIALLHRAGGRAFLAHPLVSLPDTAELARLVSELKALGLDGIEAYYGAFSPVQQQELAELASRNGLLVCAGTDLHMCNGVDISLCAIDMPTGAWKAFRDAVFSGLALAAPGESRPPLRRRLHLSRSGRRAFLLRILFPTLLAIALFIVAIWGAILPSFERTLLDRKREMIRELTNSAWSILASYERDASEGRLTREQAQKLAKERIEALRYGREGKDYFWLQDMHPHIIMHPYRKDLNGQDVSNYMDPRGVRIFVEFADLVRREGEGYLEYVWQWKDDPERLEAKESYIKGFAPWGWIIGTGLYIEDVNEEIARIERSLVYTSLIISGLVVLLLLFVVQQSMRIERERVEAEESLHESTERYRALVEASTEGTLLVLEGRCRYANPVLLHMLGYKTHQIELLDLEDLVPAAENTPVWNQVAWLEGGRQGQRQENGAAGGFEGALRRADGELVECVMTLNPITFAGLKGFILLAKEVSPRPAGEGYAESLPAIARAAQAVSVGIFCARAARRGVFVEINPAADALIAVLESAAGRRQSCLADFFHDDGEYEAFFRQLQAEGNVQNRILHVETVEAKAYTLAVSAWLERDVHGRPLYIHGIIEDVTERRRNEVEREVLIEKLQTSLLFLHEPVGRLGRHVVTCTLETEVQKVAALMTARQATAALVETEQGAPVGILTDRDLRERVVATGLGGHTPARLVMSAPLVTVGEHTLIYEALMRMEEKGVQHLAVEDESGRIVSVVRSKDLVQFHRYAPAVLTREIRRAATLEEAAQSVQRAPELVRALLNSGAHPRNITHILSTIGDAALERLIELAMDDLGTPPASFVFLAMGSLGRMEQTLLTDQDNAIIYDASDDADVGAYFLKLGEKVSAWLNEIGYPFCHGKVMASNPHWCRSLEGWKRYFSEWIQKAEPQELLDFSIAFDFRAVYGMADLAHNLRQHIYQVLREQPQFFIHLAQNALKFNLPLVLFGRIYPGSGPVDHAGQLNLKDVMMPVVSFARLYALRNQVNQTHTLDRIDVLVEKNVVLPSSRDEITASYDFLMRLRLQRQVNAILSGGVADNLIQPSRLGHIEEALLKQAFVQIAAVQKKISYDFLGGS